MASVFDKWNKAIDTKGLAKDAKEVEQNGGSGDYPEVPEGKYEVSIEKLELKESSKGDPMFVCWMKILEGQYKNSRLFFNQVITQGFQIGIVNKFLRGLDAVEDVEFIDYGQYNNLIMDIHETIDSDHLEYLVKYETTGKGFPKYTIEEVFE